MAAQQGQNTMDPNVLDDIIHRLTEVRMSRPGKQVQLSEIEIKQLCVASRDIFLQQPNLLELEAPMKICGALSMLDLCICPLRVNVGSLFWFLQLVIYFVILDFEIDEFWFNFQFSFTCFRRLVCLHNLVSLALISYVEISVLRVLFGWYRSALDCKTNGNLHTNHILLTFIIITYCIILRLVIYLLTYHCLILLLCFCF